jgi:hypothetical protein
VPITQFHAPHEFSRAIDRFERWTIFAIKERKLGITACVAIANLSLAKIVSMAKTVAGQACPHDIRSTEKLPFWQGSLSGRYL